MNPDARPTPAVVHAAGEFTAGADQESDRIHRAADELLRRGRMGLGMTDATACFRQLELAQLLQAVARAVDAGDPLPDELLRHAENLARHILSYPPAPAESPTTEPSSGATAS